MPKLEKTVKSLIAEVSEKYTLAPGIGAGEIVFMGQTLHLDKLTLAEADELVKNPKFNALIPKPSKEKK